MFNVQLVWRSGLNVKLCPERLGHSSAKMTLDVYTEALLTLERAAAATMEAIVERGKAAQQSVLSVAGNGWPNRTTNGRHSPRAQTYRVTHSRHAGHLPSLHYGGEFVFTLDVIRAPC